MKALKKMVQILWGMAIVALPFQRFLLLEQAGDSGRFNPYASVTLQASEILILMAFFLWMVQKRGKGLLAAVIAFVVLLVAQGAILHIMAAAAAIALIRNQALPHKTVAKLFMGIMVFQAVLAMAQVGLGHSVGLSMLGESIVSAQTVGAAKMSLVGATLLRAYGTFPHPNLLAGYLVVALALLITLSSKWEKRKIALAVILAVGLLLTGSKAAIGALLLAFLIRQKISIQKKGLIAAIVALIVSATFPFWENAEFITERWELLKISIAMLIQQPWGVGPHHFTLAMQDFTALKLQPWQFQPVHNIYLLVANEWGVWMGLLLGIGGLHLLRNHLKKQTLLLILPLLLIGLVDHYLVSLPQGLLLTGLAVGWLTRPTHTKTHHLKIAPTKSP